ncbi:hypothetical protein [Sphingomonas sp. 28-63-12]|uniref:hypothetical protein n=1 Tax=Sphingomonas sp. 28-63-12 TaxID=1970434 RepID=UPI000BCB9363|nr:MAG: hypothetical protein B7Y47_08200 [Sphingomonas sp. 28-63-12]
MALPGFPANRPRWMLAVYVLIAGLVVLGLTRLIDGPPSADTTANAATLDALHLGYGPKDYAAALDVVDAAVELGEQRVAQRPQDWINQESYARALMGRARLTASFDDLAAAGAALARGKGDAIGNSGPALTDAVFNISVHRSGPVPADLAIIDHSGIM